MAGQQPGRIVQNEPNSGYVPWQGHLACACEAWAGCPCHCADSPGPIVRQHLVARCRSGNKPNLARLGQGQVPGGRRMRNKANSRQPGRGLGIGVRLSPLCSPGQLRQTNPIPAAGKKRQVLCGKVFMVNSTVYRPRQNKANLGEVSSVKCQVLSRASRASSPRSLLASNSTLYTSNSAEGRSCETKPICDLQGEPMGPPPYAGHTLRRSGCRAIARGHCAHSWHGHPAREALWHRHPADDSWAGRGPPTRNFALGIPSPCHVGMPATPDDGPAAWRR